jgi:hypothetical protein
MRIEFQISELDYIAAAQLFRRTRTRWARISHPILVASRVLRLVGVTSALVICVWQGRPLKPVILCFFILVLPMMLIFDRRWRLSSSYLANPAVQRPNSVVISADGLEVTDPSTTKMRLWREFSQLEECREVFILCVREKNGYMILPKRVMSKAQVAEFRTLACARLIEGCRPDPVLAPAPNPPHLGFDQR